MILWWPQEHVSVMLAVEDAFHNGAETGAHGVTARQVNQADVRRTWPVVFGAPPAGYCPGRPYRPQTRLLVI
jgi:hypothetical protein